MMRNPELSLPLNHWIIFKNDELIIVLTIFLTSLCHQIPFLNIKKLISNLRTFKMLPVIFNHVYMYVCTHNTHVLLNIDLRESSTILSLDCAMVMM